MLLHDWATSLTFTVLLPCHHPRTNEFVDAHLPIPYHFKGSNYYCISCYGACSFFVLIKISQFAHATLHFHRACVRACVHFAHNHVLESLCLWIQSINMALVKLSSLTLHASATKTDPCFNPSIWIFHFASPCRSSPP